MNRLFFTMAGVVLCMLSSKAQTAYNEAEFKTKPIWISMMDDSTVNYYQAVRAYQRYWEGRIIPDGDADKKDEKKSRKNERKHKRYEKKLAGMSSAERNEFDRINYQCKRFKHWMFDVKPYVQANGRILTSWQRLNIRISQQEQFKQQQSKVN